MVWYRRYHNYPKNLRQYLHTLLSSVGVGTYPFFQKPFFCPVNVLIPAYVAGGRTQNGRSFSNATTPSTF